ncbi:MAG: sigma-24 [Isosphaeraceae bacterium]|jgi:RNA polymerase sigma-70 factor (ECF subfamily)|nr:MAG: sigma-24 [Isosphaeraceae bacterium]
MPETDADVATAPDDDQLLLQVRRGDRSAREELFRRHFGVAYRVAHRLLGHDHDALDAVQDGFLKAVAHLAEFDRRCEFRTWLLRIVTNAALDLGRRRRRRPTLSLDDRSALDPDNAQPSSADVVGPPVDPALNLHRSDLRRQLDAALATLSPATRATFVLFAEAELSYKEIAACQRVPIGTVMSRLHYARLKLQELLKQTTLDA